MFCYHLLLYYKLFYKGTRTHYTTTIHKGTRTHSNNICSATVYYYTILYYKGTRTHYYTTTILQGHKNTFKQHMFCDRLLLCDTIYYNTDSNIPKTAGTYYTTNYNLLLYYKGRKNTFKQHMFCDHLLLYYITYYNTLDSNIPKTIGTSPST